MTSTPRRLGALWALAAALMLPTIYGQLPLVNALFQAVGMGFMPTLAGAWALRVGRTKADAGMRQASITVLVVCALLWLGTLSR